MLRSATAAEMLTVDGIVVVESLYFLCNLCWRVERCIISSGGLSVDAPVVNKSLEHGEWTQFIELPEAAEYCQFLIRHALPSILATRRSAPVVDSGLGALTYHICPR